MALAQSMTGSLHFQPICGWMRVLHFFFYISFYSIFFFYISFYSFFFSFTLSFSHTFIYLPLFCLPFLSFFSILTLIFIFLSLSFPSLSFVYLSCTSPFFFVPFFFSSSNFLFFLLLFPSFNFPFSLLVFLSFNFLFPFYFFLPLIIFPAFIYFLKFIETFRLAGSDGVYTLMCDVYIMHSILCLSVWNRNRASNRCVCVKEKQFSAEFLQNTQGQRYAEIGLTEEKLSRTKQVCTWMIP